MDDLSNKHDKLIADANDCDLIANQSDSPAARDTFRRIANKLRKDAAGVDVVMKIRASHQVE